MDDDAYARLLGQVTALRIALSALLEASPLEVKEKVRRELEAVAAKTGQSEGHYAGGMGQTALDIIKGAFRK